MLADPKRFWDKGFIVVVGDQNTRKLTKKKRFDNSIHFPNESFPLNRPVLGVTKSNSTSMSLPTFS